MSNTDILMAGSRVRDLLRDLDPLRFSDDDEAQEVLLDSLLVTEQHLQRLKELFAQGLLAVPRCSHGEYKPHTIGGTTWFHYDVAQVCDEWAVSPRGITQDFLKGNCPGHEWRDLRLIGVRRESCRVCGSTRERVTT